MNADRIIGVLERAKHDHYSEPEGLNSCPKSDARWLPAGCNPKCDCGADEINAEIDAMIVELRDFVEVPR